jgi:hypothetical protein
VFAKQIEKRIQGGKILLELQILHNSSPENAVKRRKRAL